MERFKKILPILIILIVMVTIILIVCSLRNNKKSELDIFYSDEITSDYGDIRKLSADYNIYDAQTDKCFIVGAMVHNENVYGLYAFHNKFKKSSAFCAILTFQLYHFR